MQTATEGDFTTVAGAGTADSQYNVLSFNCVKLLQSQFFAI